MSQSVGAAFGNAWVATATVANRDHVPAKLGRGRPTKYAPELAEEICDLFAEGKSLREICNDPKFPSRRTVQRWLEEHEEFRRGYELAIFCYAEDTAREIIEIADDSSHDYTLSGDDAPVMRFDREAVARSALRCKERWTWLGKLMPEKWGDAPLVNVLRAPSTEVNIIGGAASFALNRPVNIEQDPTYSSLVAYERK